MFKSIARNLNKLQSLQHAATSTLRQNNAPRNVSATLPRRSAKNRVRKFFSRLADIVSLHPRGRRGKAATVARAPGTISTHHQAEVAKLFKETKLPDIVDAVFEGNSPIPKELVAAAKKEIYKYCDKRLMLENFSFVELYQAYKKIPANSAVRLSQAKSLLDKHVADEYNCVNIQGSERQALLGAFKTLQMSVGSEAEEAAFKRFDELLGSTYHEVRKLLLENLVEMPKEY